MEDCEFISFEEGRKFLANDHLLFLKRFYEVDLEASIKSLKIAYEKKDWIELKRSAHSLKGTSSYIGALKCKIYSEDLQLACAENPINEEKINNCTSLLLDHLDSLAKFLREYFNPIEGQSSKIKNNESKIEGQNIEESKEEYPNFIIKKIIPPVSRMTTFENTHIFDEEEIDAYEEMNKQWRCQVN